MTIAVRLCVCLMLISYMVKARDQCDQKISNNDFLEYSFPIFDTGEDENKLALSLSTKYKHFDVHICFNYLKINGTIESVVMFTHTFSFNKNGILIGTEISLNALYIVVISRYHVTLDVLVNDKVTIFPTPIHNSDYPYRTTYMYHVITVCEVLGVCQIAISTACKDAFDITVNLKMEYSTCILWHDHASYTEGDSFNVTLSRYYMLQLRSDCDMSGTLIQSRKELSVLSGGIMTVMGEGGRRQNFIGSTIPFSNAGQEYVVVGSNNSLFGDIIKILTIEDNTILNIHGNEMKINKSSKVINRRIDHGEVLYVKADKAIQISQLSRNYLFHSVMTSLLPFRSFGLLLCDHDWVFIMKLKDNVVNNTEKDNSFTSNMTRIHGTEYVMSELTDNNACSNMPRQMVVVFNTKQSRYIELMEHDQVRDEEDEPSPNFINHTSVDRGSAFIISLIDIKNSHILDLVASSTDGKMMKRNGETIQVIKYVNGMVFNETVMERVFGADSFGTLFMISTLTIHDAENTVVKVLSPVQIVLRSRLHSVDLNINMVASMLIYPINALGFKYIVGMFWTNYSISKCAIAATVNDTHVDIVLPDTEYQIKVEFRERIFYNNMKISQTLQEYVQMTLTSEQDLTGTMINTDQPVAVFCGSIESDDDNYIPPFITLEQMPPMTTLGNNFSVVEKENEIQTSANALPTESTQSTVAFKIVATRDYTLVMIIKRDATHVFEYLEHAGNFIEQDISKTVQIVTSKDVLVLQEIVTKNERCLIVVVPHHQLTNQYCFATFQHSASYAYSNEIFTTTNNYHEFFSMNNLNNPNPNLAKISFHLDPTSAYMVDFGDDIAGYIMHDSGHHGSAAGILLKENTICVYGEGTDFDCDGLKSEDMCILETYHKDEYEIDLTTPDAGIGLSIDGQHSLLKYTIPLALYGFNTRLKKSLQFDVMACNDVRIYLVYTTTSADYTFYEIIIDTDGISIIRNLNGHVDIMSLEKNTYCLYCTTYTFFTISWERDLLLTSQCADDVMLVPTANDILVEDVYVMTGSGSSGHWIFYRDELPSYVGEVNTYLPDFDLDGSFDEDCAYKTPNCGLPYFEHAYAEIPKGHGETSFDVGKTYIVHCIGGLLSGRPTTECLPTGVWSKEFKCASQPICSTPPRREYTITIHDHSTIIYKQGDTYAYECIPDYTITGSGIITCLEGGQWSESSFSCSGNTPECECPCDQTPRNINMTEDEIIKIKGDIRKQNLIDKTTVSKYKRERISAPDNRFSAKAIGYVGVTCLCTVGVVIVMIDVVSLVNTFSVITQNVGAFFRRIL